MSNLAGHRFDPDTAPKDSVKSWLQAALDGYLVDGRGVWAFEPLELKIGRDADLAGDLQRVYDSLQADAKLRWRLAVSDLLAERGGDLQHLRATVVLLDLSILMPAFEALKVLPGIVADIGEGDDARRLYDHALTVAIELSRQTEDARDCLDRMRTSPGFSPTYAGLVFIALCRAEPDEWPSHWRTMRESLDALMRQLEPESDGPRWYAESFVRAVTPARLRQDLDVFMELEDPSDDWLWNELFKGAASLLGADASGSLYVRGSSATRVPIRDERRARPAARAGVREVRMRWMAGFRDASGVVARNARTLAKRGWIPRSRMTDTGREAA